MTHLVWFLFAGLTDSLPVEILRLRRVNVSRF